MYILTIDGKEEKGAYSVENEEGEQIIYLFEEEDDATRYAMMLEEKEYPPMNVLEVDDELLIKACEVHNYQYTIITENDIVIPPDTNDFIS
jgi:hypothetical protein